MAEISTFAGWFKRKLIILTYTPINPFIFKTETFDSEDNILADSEISSELIILLSVSLYIFGIIQEKINTNKNLKDLGQFDRRYFIIVTGIDK